MTVQGKGILLRGAALLKGRTLRAAGCLTSPFFLVQILNFLPWPRLAASVFSVFQFRIEQA